MIDLDNNKSFVFSESERNLIRDALESYRNVVTKKMFSTEARLTEYYDIELLEIDEIFEKLGEE